MKYVLTLLPSKVDLRIFKNSLKILNLALIYALIPLQIIAAPTTPDLNVPTSKISNEYLKVIPATLGHVTEVWSEGNSGMVYLIKDTHDSLEAQKNIASLVSYLTSRYEVSTVLEEGYAGKLPTEEYFGWIKDHEEKKYISELLLDQLRLGGAEFAHISAAVKYDLIGVDDQQAHEQGIQSFSKTKHLQQQSKRMLLFIQRYLQNLAIQKLPKRAWQSLKLQERYHHNQISLDQYLREMLAILERGKSLRGLDQSYPTIFALQKLINSKHAFDDERYSGDFFENLDQEIKELEEDVRHSLHLSTEQREILFFADGYFLLEKVIDLKLRPEEYEWIKTNWHLLGAEQLVSFMSQQLQKTVVIPSAWEESVQSAFEFYESNVRRDQTVEENIKKIFDHEPEASAVLVFGGYHASQLTQILQRVKINYVVITPKVSRISKRHEGIYQKLMAHDLPSYESFLNLSRASRPLSVYRIVSPNEFRMSYVPSLLASSLGKNDPKPLNLKRNPLTTMVVTVDGPAGAGKGTISKILADRLGFLYVDSGGLFRAIALKVRDQQITASDEGMIEALLSQTTVDMKDVQGSQRIILDGRDISDEIRSAEISSLVPQIAIYRSVQEYVLQATRIIGESHDSVMDGRQMGTEVFPDATGLKFYLTAPTDVRAERRLLQLRQQGDLTTYLDDLINQIEARDQADRGRAIGPLRQPDDAIVVMNEDGKTIDGLVQMMETQVRQAAFNRGLVNADWNTILMGLHDKEVLEFWQNSLRVSMPTLAEAESVSSPRMIATFSDDILQPGQLIKTTYGYSAVSFLDREENGFSYVSSLSALQNQLQSKFNANEMILVPEEALHLTLEGVAHDLAESVEPDVLNQLARQLQPHFADAKPVAGQLVGPFWNLELGIIMVWIPDMNERSGLNELRRTILTQLEKTEGVRPFHVTLGYFRQGRFSRDEMSEKINLLNQIPITSIPIRLSQFEINGYSDIAFIETVRNEDNMVRLGSAESLGSRSDKEIKSTPWLDDDVLDQLSLEHKTVVVDFKDLEANFSVDQLKELLYILSIKGKVLLTNFDPSKPLGRFFRDQLHGILPEDSAPGGLILSQEVTQAAVQRHIQDKSDLIYFLMSSKSQRDREAEMRFWTLKNYDEKHIYYLAYSDEHSGILGLGLKYLNPFLLKEKIPDFFKRDFFGRYTASAEATSTWQSLYSQHIALSQSA